MKNSCVFANFMVDTKIIFGYNFVAPLNRFHAFPLRNLFLCVGHLQPLQ